METDSYGTAHTTIYSDKHPATREDCDVRSSEPETSDHVDRVHHPVKFSPPDARSKVHGARPLLLIKTSRVARDPVSALAAGYARRWICRPYLARIIRSYILFFRFLRPMMRCWRCGKWNEAGDECAKAAGCSSNLSARPAVTSMNPATVFADNAARRFRRQPQTAENPRGKSFNPSATRAGAQADHGAVCGYPELNKPDDSLGDPELGMRRLAPVLALMKDAVTNMTAPSINPKATESWPCSARRGPTRIMPFAAASRRWRCGTRSPSSTIRNCRSASGSIPARWSFRAWRIPSSDPMTPPAPMCTSQTAWSRWRKPTAFSSRRHLGAARQFVEVEALGAQAVRGLAVPIEVFKLTALRNAPASEVFRSGIRLDRLVGRNEQFAALERELAETRRKRPRGRGRRRSRNRQEPPLLRVCRRLPS